jgi:endonuclease/exonuclease/phosphatase (EEP) superfamily protein YafD
MRIDYVFADDSISVLRCLVPETTASDHRPLIADLIVPKKGE